MSNTRREFLQTSAAVAMGIMTGATSKVSGEESSATQVPNARTVSQGMPAPSEVYAQVPKMKLGNAEISRLVLGVNPFYGFSHYNQNFSSAMSDWYTQEKVCEVMHRANLFGINAFNYVNVARAASDWARFQDEGGKMHLIIQVGAGDDSKALVRDLKPLALQRQGEVVDVAYRNRTMDTVREWCKQARDLGVVVGVGTHKPEVIELIEEQGWDVDFYSGCVYNRTRSDDEWRQTLNGHLLEMPRDIYLQDDPAHMYKVMRQTSKVCFAFKILAAGRIADHGVKQAFRTAFESIKATDGIYVGMFPRFKDEVKEDAEIVHDVLMGT